MIPWSSALVYGNSLFNSFPQLKLFIIPTIPILLIKQTIPIGNFLFLLILFLGIVRNQKISYFIRFNAMQAILLNIVLVIYSYIEILLIRISKNFFILEALQGIIFISSLTIILFVSIQSFRGIEADIPVISNSAKIQI